MKEATQKSKRKSSVDRKVLIRNIVHKHLNDIVRQDPHTDGSSFLINDKNKAAIEAIINYLENPTNRGILLSGPVGTGKSTLMKCLIHSMASCHSKTITPHTAPFIKSNYYDQTYGDQSTLKEQLHYYKYIAINDLGLERNYSTGVNIIQEILFDRYENQKVSFGSTNLTTQEFYERYDDSKNRMLDRFESMFEIISVTGKSYR